MKLKTIAMVAAIGVLTLSNCVYAKGMIYTPPERLNCTVSQPHHFNCDEFNHNYLTEDATNADYSGGKDEVFHFVSAVAYFTNNKQEASVFFTYNNVNFKMVKLRSVNTSIQPALNEGQWHKFNEDIYYCNASYFECPITNLPNA